MLDQFSSQTRDNIKDRVSKFRFKKITILRSIELLVIQTKVMQLTFYTEFVELYSSFPTKQLKLFLKWKVYVESRS